MLSNPPRYRYGLFDSWDAKAFEFIQTIARKKDLPAIIGDEQAINQCIITLIRTQKSLHGWRSFLKAILNQIKRSNSVNVAKLNAQYPPDAIDTMMPAWVTYKEDRIVSAFMDELGKRKISFIGTRREKSEFVIRFILGQLAHDWEQTIMMIWEVLGRKNAIRINSLNKELRNFDYCRLFR